MHFSRESQRFFPLKPICVLACLFFFLADAHSSAQDQPQIALQVKTVSVFATVRDKHGKLVSNLTKNDFQIEEDGRPQVINYFAKEADLPLRLGLLVDTSLSQGEVLDQEREASSRFLDRLLRPAKDQAFVIQFDRQVELLRDFTSDKIKLQASLHLLESSEFQSTPGGGRERSEGWGNGASTLLYDAIFLAADELMSKQQGRKAVILLSDGIDRGSRETVEEAIERAQRSDTLIYSILFADEEGRSEGGHKGGPYGAPKRHDSQRPDGKYVLQEISEKTGGRFFQVSKKESIEKIYTDIEEELHSQYNLGYTPDKGAGPGFHKIQVTTRNKDLKVQARQGYYGGP